MQHMSSYLSARSVLIIDGPNLVYKFHEHMKLDFLCGGQYEELYKDLTEFLSALRDCPNLRVLMLLEEVTEEDKLEVVKARKLEKLKQWVDAIKQAQSQQPLIPLCAWDVFKEAVRSCGIEILHYDSEADDFLSALALHYTKQGIRAFILSNDTDFNFTKGVTGFFPWRTLCGVPPAVHGLSWSRASFSPYPTS